MKTKTIDEIKNACFVGIVKEGYEYDGDTPIFHVTHHAVCYCIEDRFYNTDGYLIEDMPQVRCKKTDIKMCRDEIEEMCKKNEELLIEYENFDFNQHYSLDLEGDPDAAE